MKNRNVITFAIGMIFTGLLLLIVATMAGARVDSAMDNVKVFLNTKQIESKEDLEPMSKDIVPVGEIFPSSMINELELEISAAQVDIISGNDFSVKATDNICKMKHSSNKLKIYTEHKGFGWFKFLGKTPKIQITVPYNVSLEKLDIELGAGQLISSTDIKCQDAKLKIGAGECKIQNLIATEGLTVECGMGSVQVAGKVTGKAKVQCGMGEVKMNLQGNPEDYSYQLEVGMGSVRFNDTEISGMGGNTKSSNSAQNYFKVECGMGAVDIKFGR